MKHVKHCLFAAITALLLMVAFGGSAFAVTITVNPGNQPTSGHSYNAYQIFTGQYDSANNKIYDVNWSNAAFGNSVVQKLLLPANKSEFSTAVQNKLNGSDAPVVIQDTTNTVESKEQAGKVAYMIDTINENSDDAKLFAQIVKQAIDETSSPQPTHLTLQSGVYTANVDVGYYLIVDSTTSSSGVQNDFVSDLILKVAGSAVEVSPKGNVPSVIKKVKENNTTDGTWQDTADYNIGDMVPFQLTGTLPDDFNRYNTYKYIFTDTYSAGLTLDSSTVKVFFDKDGNTADTSDKKEITSSMQLDTTQSGNFIVSFENLKAANSEINSKSKIIVEYSARLNDSAVIGTSTSNSNSGNPNTIKLTYSNNPSGEGTGDTPTDTVYVFTYELDVNKVNRDNPNDKAAGAEFILFSIKKNAYAILSGNNISSWTTDESAATKMTSNDSGQFIVYGLDAGTYRLIEKKAPTNYVLPANPNTEFTISADLTSEATSVSDAITNLKIDSTQDITKNADTAAGKVSLTIKNAREGSLPSTGSMGMFIMIGVGICLMAGAGVYLLKNRNKA